MGPVQVAAVGGADRGRGRSVAAQPVRPQWRLQRGDRVHHPGALRVQVSRLLRHVVHAAPQEEQPGVLPARVPPLHDQRGVGLPAAHRSRQRHRGLRRVDQLCHPRHHVLALLRDLLRHQQPAQEVHHHGPDRAVLLMRHSRRGRAAYRVRLPHSAGCAAGGVPLLHDRALLQLLQVQLRRQASRWQGQEGLGCGHRVCMCARGGVMCGAVRR
mmetsp:Transcript_22733/g.73130  ORF Transcript_22733/g.73130 Transcript_22733/m.73130 type:complete len:213 (-) Transcript_22733:54-692(-)